MHQIYENSWSETKDVGNAKETKNENVRSGDWPVEQKNNKQRKLRRPRVARRPRLILSEESLVEKCPTLVVVEPQRLSPRRDVGLQAILGGEVGNPVRSKI